MPQLPVEGIEKSGTSIPERRAPSDDAVIAGDSGRCNENAADPRHYPSSIHESETALERVGKTSGSGSKLTTTKAS